jgi:predicted transcriptional regulator of viral defense system
MLPKVYQRLQRKGVITLTEVAEIVGSRQRASKEVLRLKERGYLCKIKAGLYTLVPPELIGQSFSPDKFLIGSRLAKPYAFSHHSAFELHGIAHSVFQQVIITAKDRFKNFRFDGIEYVCVVGKYLFGETTVIHGGEAIQVTDIERTLLDCLRRVDLAGGIEEIIRSLEGLRGLDLLESIHAHMMTQNSAPSIRKFRADHEDRRADIDQLKEARYISESIDHYTLTLLGLLNCRTPQAQEDLRLTERVFTHLRKLYKETPGQGYPAEKIASDLSLETIQVQRALTYLQEVGIAAQIGRAQTGFINGIEPAENILDCKTFEDLIRKQKDLSDEMKQVTRTSPIPYIQYERLLKYLKRFDDASLYAKTGFLLRLFERDWNVPQEIFQTLRKRVTEVKYYFPPNLKRGSGRLISEWNLIVPKTLETIIRSRLPEG